jgi:hypothetical protein
VHDRVWDHAHAGDLGRLSRLPLDEGGHESPLDPRGAGEQRLQRGGHPGLDASRSRHHQRTHAAAELAVEQDERHAAEVVAMQVRDQDRVDGGRVDAGPAQRDQGGGAAVQ